MANLTTVYHAKTYFGKKKEKMKTFIEIQKLGFFINISNEEQ